MGKGSLCPDVEKQMLLLEDEYQCLLLPVIFATV